MKFLAFSDLHLDAPFAQGGPDLAKLRRSNLRYTLRRIVELAGELDVDALMCAGDLYEHDRFTPDTVKLLERVFDEVAPMPVLISPGNHDWYGPSSIYATASWSPNVHIFKGGELAPWDGLDGVRVWGFAHCKPSGTGDPLAHFHTEGDALHVGLLHGSEISQWSWAAKEDPNKQRHAPFSANQIETVGLSHCVVGHYHKKVEGEWHTYGGAPTALSFGEPGNGGAVEVTFDGSGGPPNREWHRVSSLEVHADLELDVTGCSDLGQIEDMLRHLVAPLTGIARVTVQGDLEPDLEPDLDLDVGSLRQQSERLDYLSIRSGDIRTGYDLDSIAEESTVRGQFVRTVKADVELPAEDKQRVIITGLRALAGRKDLEVV